MNYKINIFSIVLIVSLLSVNLYSGDAGNNGFTLLKIEVDARAAAMGGAYTAIADDASASFWNPAGLAGATSKSFNIMYHSVFEDISQEFAAAHLLTGKHNLALSVNLLTFSNIEIRGNVPTEEPSGTTEAMNFVGMISYSRYLFEDYAVGVNLKYLFEKYYLEKASGWAVDLGIKKKNIINNLDLGITVQNLGQMSELKDKSTPLPLIFSGGLGYTVPVEILGNSPLLATDIQYINDEDVYYHFGSKLDLLTYFVIRLGWIAGAAKNEPTFGLGLNYSNFHFDYSYSPVQYQPYGSQRVSFGFIF